MTDETWPRLPIFWEMTAPLSWVAIDFISDLHLSGAAPKTLAAFADHMRHTDADAVFILGDLFELWVGDDARDGKFEAQHVDILTEATAHKTVAFMPGNRDFLVGTQMLKACGVMALPDPTVLHAFGERLLLTHGDALCLADQPYQIFRKMVRSEAWQQDFLAKPLNERRALGKRMRSESESRKRLPTLGEWIDVDIGCTVRWMHEAGTPTLIHGHTHHPATESMAPGYSRWVLSDWDLETYARPPRADVLRLNRAGLKRMSPCTAKSDVDLSPVRRVVN